MDKIILCTPDELRELIRKEVSGIVAEEIRCELGKRKEKELLSFKEAAELLNCSASALNKWKSEGKVPYRKIGKKILFERIEILNAINSK